MNINKKWVPLIIIGIAFLLAFGFKLFFPVTVKIWNARVNDHFFKLRYALKGREKIFPGLCVFNLDDRDWDALNITLTDRTIFAEIIETLTVSGVDTVAVDIIFRNPNPGPGDKLLVQSTLNGGNIFYPLKITTDSDSKSSIINIPFSLAEKALRNPGIKTPGSPLKAGGVIAPFLELALSSKGLGGINYKPGPDGTARKIPLLFQTEKGYIPSLALAVLAHYLNVLPENIELAFGQHIMLKGARFPDGFMRDLRIPIDRSGQMNINYPGFYKDSVPGFSIQELVRYGRDPEKKRALMNSLGGTLVVFSEISSRNLNKAATIFDTLAPHNEVLVSALNTILTENFLYEPGDFDPFSLAAGCLLFLSLLFLSARDRVKWLIPAAALFYLLFILVHFLLFFHFNRLSNFMFQSVGYGLAAAGILFLNYVKVTEEKKRYLRRYEALKETTLQLEESIKGLEDSTAEPAQNINTSLASMDDDLNHGLRDNKETGPLFNTLKLSDREKEVALQLINGSTNSQIAEELYVSGNTVKFHIKNIFKKAGVNNRNSFTRLCFEKLLKDKEDV